MRQPSSITLVWKLPRDESDHDALSAVSPLDFPPAIDSISVTATEIVIAVPLLYE
jgi:hypothetical protein